MKRPRTRTRRALWWSVAVAAAILLLITGFTWRLIALQPTWWNPAEPQSPETLSRGEYFENQIVTAFHKVRPADSRRWTLELDAQWINAWLATRLPLWAANRNLSWSSTVRQANASIGNDWIRIGLRYGSGEGGQVYSIGFRPLLDEQGRLRLADLRLYAGRLRLPLGLAANSLGAITRSIPEVQAVIAGESLEAIFRLSDGRRVALRELTFQDTRIVLTLETLPER